MVMSMSSMVTNLYLVGKITSVFAEEVGKFVLKKKVTKLLQTDRPLSNIGMGNRGEVSQILRTLKWRNFW